MIKYDKKNQKLISELTLMFVWTVTQALTFNLIPNLISLRRSRLRGRRERERLVTGRSQRSN